MRNAFTGKGEKPRFLLQIFKAHNNNIEKLIGKDYAKPTLTKYNTTVNHLENFLKWKFKTSDISLSQLKYEFLADFEFYLKSEKASTTIPRQNISRTQRKWSTIVSQKGG
ncbi:MAG: phage integrase SAM-like domain-containing protein [Chitinophagaceae bacterium]|nr:phage integrase SAM-like domain-containing protein [Chitinophagaceae bacterium]